MGSETRPVFLALNKMRFPATALVSICHRISGVLMFLTLPVLLFFWQASLHNAAGFVSIKSLISTGFMGVFVWLVLSAWLFHILAGLRHILMDFGWGGSLVQAMRSAKLCFVVFVVLAILVRVVLW